MLAIGGNGWSPPIVRLWVRQRGAVLSRPLRRPGVTIASTRGATMSEFAGQMFVPILTVMVE
jgi:hypothetical protein